MPPKFNASVLNSELHKSVRHKFEKRRVMVYAVNDTWASDLMDMQEWYKENNGYKYGLCVIDVFSKYAWVIPLLHVH